MSRRGENIRKRKDGRWEARVISGYDVMGKAKYRSVYGKSYQEVREKRKHLIEKKESLFADNYAINRQKITVKQIMREWLVSKKDSVKESTFVNYNNLLERHILPELGDYYLLMLTTDMVNAFLRGKLLHGRRDGRGGLSAKTVSDIRTVLIMGLEYARQHDYQCAVNGKIFYPRNEQPDIKVLSREEQKKLEEYIFRNPGFMELGIMISLYGGLRIGEICALQWKDFQFENGTVTISKTMIRIQNMDAGQKKKTKILIDRPKTESSNRVIPLPTFLLELLKSYEKEPDIYLLTGRHKWMEPRVCLDQYKKVLANAGLDNFTFHTLRHTFATRCVESGFDTKSLSEILGHSNVNTTLQRYVHPPMTHKKEQMERLAELSVANQK